MSKSLKLYLDQISNHPGGIRVKVNPTTSEKVIKLLSQGWVRRRFYKIIFSSFPVVNPGCGKNGWCCW